MSYLDKKFKLFTLSANKPLAESIAKSAKIPLSNVEVIKFADGEITTNIEESVRGNHVFVVQPTSAPANDHLMEVLVLADALKRASAASITILMPYFGYSRQDRKAKSRQPITAKLVANLLTVAGIDRLVCIDLHAAQIQGFFDIPIDNFPAAPLLASYFSKKKLENVDKEKEKILNNAILEANKIIEEAVLKATNILDEIKENLDEMFDSRKRRNKEF